jgi:hypothetical protein
LAKPVVEAVRPRWKKRVIAEAAVQRRPVDLTTRKG